jgi:hypothetical protein
LFGRIWLSKLTLDWHHIRSVSACFSVKDKVNELMKMDVFNDELGTVKGIQASLKLKEGATLKLYKPRPVPYALRDKVADEIKRLEKLGIIEKKDFSEYAAPHRTRFEIRFYISNLWRLQGYNKSRFGSSSISVTKS